MDWIQNPVQTCRHSGAHWCNIASRSIGTVFRTHRSTRLWRMPLSAHPLLHSWAAERLSGNSLASGSDLPRPTAFKKPRPNRRFSSKAPLVAKDEDMRCGEDAEEKSGVWESPCHPQIANTPNTAPSQFCFRRGEYREVRGK